MLLEDAAAEASRRVQEFGSTLLQNLSPPTPQPSPKAEQVAQALDLTRRGFFAPVSEPLALDPEGYATTRVPARRASIAWSGPGLGRPVPVGHSV
jgi:hypothetical protein